MNIIDHTESVAQELNYNGFHVSIIADTIILYIFIGGEINYKCSEKTVMADYYRFISHLGNKMHQWGLEMKIKELNKLTYK